MMEDGCSDHRMRLILGYFFPIPTHQITHLGWRRLQRGVIMDFSRGSADVVRAGFILADGDEFGGRRSLRGFGRDPVGFHQQYTMKFAQLRFRQQRVGLTHKIQQKINSRVVSLDVEMILQWFFFGR